MRFILSILKYPTKVEVAWALAHVSMKITLSRGLKPTLPGLLSETSILSILYILSQPTMWKRLDFSVPPCLRGEFLPLLTFLMHTQAEQLPGDSLESTASERL